MFDALSALAVAALVGLGIWQLNRRASKLDLIARVEARVHAASKPAPIRDEWSTVTAARDEYRHVFVTGSFANVRPVAVQAVTERGGGFWVIQPLLRDDGTIALVNRGFVPMEQRDAATPAPQSEPVTVTGLLRLSEPGGAFLRSNDPASDRWYSRDVQAIAVARGLQNVAPYFVDAEGTPGDPEYPVAGLTVVAFHNNHLIYAITWFSLAMMLAGWAIVGRRRQREDAPSSSA